MITNPVLNSLLFYILHQLVTLVAFEFTRSKVKNQTSLDAETYCKPNVFRIFSVGGTHIFKSLLEFFHYQQYFECTVMNLLDETSSYCIVYRI